MRYVLLIYGSEAVTAGMTQEEHTALMLGHAAFAQEAQQRSLLTGGAPLQPTSTATTVRVRNGKTTMVDGPFSETKEVLGGFNLIEAENIDEAMRIAASFPWADTGCIEVRPVRDISAVAKRVGAQRAPASARR